MILEIFWLVVAIIVPWALGSGIVRLCVASPDHFPSSLVIGLGFPVGMYLAAGLIWISLQTGLGLPVHSILGVMLAATISVWWCQFDNWKHTFSRWTSRRGSRFRVNTTLVLIAILTLGPIIVDVWLRPLFPWDAWFSYGLKAKLIFSLKEMPVLVGYNEWFLAEGPLAHYTSTSHPLTISLIQAWMAGAIGRWSESLVNLPWPMLLLSLALVFHGTARALTHSRAIGALAFAIVITVPAYGVHTVLAGYLDLWLGTWLAILAASVCLWLRHGGWRLGLLSGIAIAGCIFSKDTAIAYLLPIFFGALLALLSGTWRVITLAGMATLVAVGMTFFALNPQPTIYISFGGSTEIGFVDGVLQVPFTRNYTLTGPHTVWPTLAESLLFSRNFHILGWGLLAAALIALSRFHRSQYASFLAGFTITTVALLHFAMGYTRAGEILALGTIDLRLLIPITATAASIALCMFSEMTSHERDGL